VSDGRIPSTFGEFSTTLEKTFFVSEISAGPRNTPIGSKGLPVGPNVTTPQIWGSKEISAGMGVSLKIVSCRIFFKNIFSFFLLLFFPIFFQKFSKSNCQYFGWKRPQLSNFFGNVLFEVFRNHLVHILL
jgi:hypothetical protein